MIPPIQSSQVSHVPPISQTRLKSCPIKPIEKKEISDPDFLPSLVHFIQDLLCFLSNFRTSITALFSRKKLVIDSSHEPIQIKNVNELKINDSNQQRISSLIQEISTSSLKELAWNAGKLSKSGKILKREVHPFRFLLEVFRDDHSKKCLQKIAQDRTSYFSGRSRIWSDFSKNLGENFENRQGDIEPYIDSFSEVLGLEAGPIRLFCQDKNWEGLLLFLVHSNI